LSSFYLVGHVLPELLDVYRHIMHKAKFVKP